MRRRVHADSNNLDWSVRLVWMPEAIRPIGLRQVYSAKVGAGGRFDQTAQKATANALLINAGGSPNPRSR